MRYIILDLESHAIPDAATYLTEPVDAPSNYVKQQAKDDYIAKAKQAQLDKAALDIDLARIVCLGYRQVGDQIGPMTLIFKDETQEMTALGKFFSLFDSHNTADWPTLIGFNLLGFDVPLLLRRALYLGVKAPNIQIDRFKHPHVIDLMDLLSYSGKMKPHSLSFYCQRFGIPVDDENSGKDIAALIAADNWAAVEAHCASDVQATYSLAKRMGLCVTGMLFDEEELVPWLAEWQNMPEYDVQDLAPKFQLIVNFTCAADVEDFGKLLGQSIAASNGKQLQSVWFPEQEIGRMVNKRYIEVKR